MDALTDETVSFLHLEDLKTKLLVRPRSFIDPECFTWMFKYNGFNDWANTHFSEGELGRCVTAMC